MPIYDHNGSVLSEIGKLYDYNGSTLSQIGKVYDNNGSANSLIYNAQSPSSAIILNGTDQITSITNGWHIWYSMYAYLYKFGTYNGATGVCLSFNNASNGFGLCHTNNKIEISGWSNLNLDYYWQSGYGDAEKGPGRIYIGLVTSVTYGDIPTTDWTVYNSVWKDTNTSGSGTLSVNVGSISGSYYVLAYRKNGDGKKTFTTVFKKIYFS